MRTAASTNANCRVAPFWRALNIAVYAEDVPYAVTRNILANLGITIMSGPGVNQSPGMGTIG